MTSLPGVVTLNINHWRSVIVHNWCIYVGVAAFLLKEVVVMPRQPTEKYEPAAILKHRCL